MPVKKTCVKCQKKYSTFWWLERGKFSIFQTKYLVSRKNKALPTFLFEFLRSLISIIKW